MSLQDVQPGIKLRGGEGLFDPLVSDRDTGQEGEDATTKLSTKARPEFARMQLTLETALLSAVFLTVWVKGWMSLGQMSLHHVRVFLLPTRVGFRFWPQKFVEDVVEVGEPSAADDSADEVVSVVAQGTVR